MQQRKRNNRTRNKRQARRADRQLLTGGKQLGQINKNISSDETIRTIVRYLGKVNSDGAGQVNTRFSLRNPLRAQDGSGSYNEIAEWAALYDEYKVNRFILQFCPVAPVGITSLGVLVTCCDFDVPDTALVGGLGDAIDYNNMKSWNPRLQFETWVKPPVISSARTLVVGDPAVVHQGGWFDFQIPPLDGNMFLTGENHPASTLIGRVILTLDISCRRRR